MSFRKRKIICRPVSRFVQVPSTAPHGFLIPEKESSKMPCEGECASPTGPSPSDSLKDTEATEPSQKKAKSSQHVSGHGASSKSQHGHDVFQGCSSGGAYGLNSDPFGSDAPYQGLPLGSHFPSGSATPSGPPPMSSSSAGPTPVAPYQKAGYTVAITNGSLCYSGEDKGMVMMISGTPFVILIANGNSHGK